MQKSNANAPKVLVLDSIAAMIDLFNRGNIAILAA